MNVNIKKIIKCNTYQGRIQGGACAACTPLFEKRVVRRTPLFFAPHFFFAPPPPQLFAYPSDVTVGFSC